MDQDFPKKWYIVNTQTGCEQTAKSAIEEKIKSNMCCILKSDLS